MTLAKNGFSLIELIVAMAILAVISALAYPVFTRWQANATYRETSLELLRALRRGRDLAINSNRETRVEIQLAQKRYRLRQGNRSSNSSSYTVVVDWQNLPDLVTLKGDADCKGSTDITFGFNPNGTSNAGYVCVMDNATPPVRRARVGIPSSNTGRPVID